MGFLGVYTAIYDYSPQGEGELTIAEGDLLFVIEKNTEDDWWKAKKRASDEDDEEPVGLIPNNYVEEAPSIAQAKALYDYTRQTEEELSLTEDASLHVYDVKDPDWTLVGLDGEYGFVPANYIEVQHAGKTRPTRAASTASSKIDTNDAPPTPSSVSTPIHTPAAALAGILAQKTSSAPTPRAPVPSTPPEEEEDSPPLPRRPTFTPEASDEEAPNLPTRPRTDTASSVPDRIKAPRSPRSPPATGPVASPPYNRARHIVDEDDEPRSPVRGGYHLYNINEVVSVMGKQKKVPTTMGINSATGTVMISPAKSRDGEQQEWTADKLVHYSLEGKHVFMELVKPSKSVDFHAGAKDTAEEIVSALGEIAGAIKAEGLREVIAASKGGSQKKGRMLYDFVAQGDDEVTVGDKDEVIILDDLKSDEWWMVRRVKNGKEGVVPSSYVEITGIVETQIPATSGINAGKSTVEQNRLEEERLAREATKSSKARDRSGSNLEVGPGVKLPKRGSSLMVTDNGNGSSSQRKREGKTESRSPPATESRPNAARTRTWTDRSGSFKVEAEFLGCREGKIHLHKLNGVKIAVPVVKMSKEDLEYVERMTGTSLDEDKPLSDIRKSKSKSTGARTTNGQRSGPKAGATIEPSKSEYDWFDFFLSCGVGVHECERYARNFTRDSMDEAILPDISSSNLRTLGLKEGDILRVMKFLDSKYNRSAGSRSKRNVSFGGAEVIGNGEAEEETQGGLFSGPGGALRNNTRKSRPAPAVATNDTVDPKAFGNKNQDAKETPLTKAPPPIEKDVVRGFDDDAWDVKPSKQAAQPAQQTSKPVAPKSPETKQPPTGAMADLSLLDAPLQPNVVHTTGTQQSSAAAASQSPVTSQPQAPPQIQQPPAAPQGATPSFFTQLGQQQTGAQLQPQNQPQSTGLSLLNSQPTGQYQRPQAPPLVQGQGSLMPPPPPRPLSAPQNVSQQNTFGPPPLQPQLTGYQNPSQFQPIPQTQIAPAGQSMNEINQMRLQQQQIAPQMTGYMQPNGIVPQPTGFSQQAMFPQQTGFNQQQFQASQPYAPQPGVSAPFSNPSQPPPFQSIAPQPTGFQNPQPTGYQPQPSTGINSVLPPALLPQPTGQNGFGQGYQQQQIPPVPPIPQNPTALPLIPQKTGPPPPIRFGVTPAAQKLAPQPTGRRANLSQATPDNPFGFE